LKAQKKLFMLEHHNDSVESSKPRNVGR
jgi:hypothetical protein